MDLDVKVAEIVVVGNGANPGDSFWGLGQLRHLEQG